MSSFAEWLRFRMGRQLLSPDLVAAELDLPEVFVEAWLAGTNAPGLAPCRLLAQLFGVPVTDVWAHANEALRDLALSAD